jgi:hypothetical protein
MKQNPSLCIVENVGTSRRQEHPSLHSSAVGKILDVFILKVLELEIVILTPL